MSVVTETPCASIIEQISQEPQRQFWICRDEDGLYVLNPDGSGPTVSYLTREDCFVACRCPQKGAVVEEWSEDKLVGYAHASGESVVVCDREDNILWRLV